MHRKIRAKPAAKQTMVIHAVSKYLPDDVVRTIISFADVPLYVLCRICKYANVFGSARQLHIVSRKIPNHVIARICALTMHPYRFAVFDKYIALTALDVSDASVNDNDIMSLVQLRKLVFTTCSRITNMGISALTNLEDIRVNDIITDRGISAMSLHTLGVGAAIENISMFTRLHTLHIGATSMIIPPTNIRHLHITDNIKITEDHIATCTDLQTLSLHGKTRVRVIRASPITLSLLKNSTTSCIPRSVTRLTISPGQMYNIDMSPRWLVILPSHKIVAVNGKRYAVHHEQITPRRESMYVW